MFCVRVFVCTEDFKNILRLDITMVVTLKCALIAGLVNIKVYVLSQTYNSSVNKKEKINFWLVFFDLYWLLGKVIS